MFKIRDKHKPPTTYKVDVWSHGTYSGCFEFYGLEDRQRFLDEVDSGKGRMSSLNLVGGTLNIRPSSVTAWRTAR